MNDNKPKGAYIPFRELLSSREFALMTLFRSLINLQCLKAANIVETTEILSVRKSTEHYDELLRMHKMEEVK